jgi:hypothetical protein
MNSILYSCNDTIKNIDIFDPYFDIFKNVFDKYQSLYSFYQTISCNKLNMILIYSYLFSVILFLVSIIIIRKTYNDIKYDDKNYLKLQIEHKKLISKFNKLKIALYKIDFIAKNKNQRSAKKLSYISSEILSVSREINKKY